MKGSFNDGFIKPVPDKILPLPILWESPTDWPDISRPVDNTINLLVADTTYATYAFKVIVTGGGTYTVDWGDGVIDAGIASDALAQHTYTVGAGLPCTRGYTTFVITITASNTITRFYTQPHTIASQIQEHGYLDAEFGTSGLTTLANMFYVTTGATVFCYMLEHCRFNSTLGSCTAATSTFRACTSLQSVDVSNLIAVTNTTAMFFGCSSLQAIDISGMIAVTDASNMFEACTTIQSVNITGLTALTNATRMFAQCSTLQSVDMLSLTALITASSMFISCSSLSIIDLTGLALVTGTSAMFEKCFNLSSVNVTGMVKVSSSDNMFFQCYSLREVTGLSGFGSTATSLFARYMFYAVERFTTIDLSGAKLSAIIASGELNKLNKLTSLLFHASSAFGYAVPAQIEINYCSFSVAELETLYLSLPIVTTKTISSTGTTGSANVSKTACGTTSGSTTVTQANTSSLATGMEVTGAGISTAVAVTFTDAGDLVGKAAHGIPNGTIVYFQTIVTTTGIVVKTPYYVVNAGANDFQVSLTLGGAPIALTTNGTGTVFYGTTIVSINPNVSFTLSIPASATASVTTVSSVVKRSFAAGRGWTVTP